MKAPVAIGKKERRISPGSLTSFYIDYIVSDKESFFRFLAYFGECGEHWFSAGLEVFHVISCYHGLKDTMEIEMVKGFFNNRTLRGCNQSDWHTSCTQAVQEVASAGKELGGVIVTHDLMLHELPESLMTLNTKSLGNDVIITIKAAFDNFFFVYRVTQLGKSMLEAIEPIVETGHKGAIKIKEYALIFAVFVAAMCHGISIPATTNT